MTTATEIQAVATVESLLNPIDQLSVLDRQQKALTAQVKSLKDEISQRKREILIAREEVPSIPLTTSRSSA